MLPGEEKGNAGKVKQTQARNACLTSNSKGEQKTDSVWPYLQRTSTRNISGWWMMVCLTLLQKEVRKLTHQNTFEIWYHLGYRPKACRRRLLWSSHNTCHSCMKQTKQYGDVITKGHTYKNKVSFPNSSKVSAYKKVWA